MDDEFTKLYELLASLSKKNKNEVILPGNEEKEQSQEQPQEQPQEQSQEQPQEQPQEQSQEKEKAKKTQRRNECIPCVSCKREFYTDGFLIRHLRHNPKCKKYTEKFKMREQQKKIKEEQKKEDEQKQIDEQKTKQGLPLHKYINECLERSITGEPLQCRFCKEHFTSSYMHYRHYEVHSACNTLAYAEFKKYL